MYATRIAAVAAISLTLVLSATYAREWKSADGKYSIDAELVDSDGTSVRLKVRDGAVISVPLDKLSDADRTYVNDARSTPAPAPVGEPMSEEEIKAALSAMGLRVGGVSLAHDDESKLIAQFSALDKSKRALFKANKELAAAEQLLASIKQSIVNLRQLNVQLNARLTTINPTDFAENNRLVGAINANQSQMVLGQQRQQEVEEHLRKIRADANKVREAYVEEVLALRTLTDEIKAKFEALAQDPQAIKLLAQLNAATGKQYEFSSRTFDSSQRKLAALEDTILSEKIKLRRDNSGTFYVSVVIGGEHTYEMAVDSGASLISLPDKLAREMGVEVNSNSPRISLVLADGREIDGWLVTLPSVRVGKFTLENVEAAVLAPQAVRAEPLLGMSFLEKFKFEIDAQESTLTMVKVEEN